MQNVSWVYILFTAVTAFGVLLQAMVLLGMFLALKGALTRLNQISQMAEEHVIPTLAAAQQILADATPKIKTAVQNIADVSAQVVELSQKLKGETEHVTQTLDILLKKTEAQADRVDEMVTGTLNSVAHATATVQHAVTAPVRQISAVFSGLRAGFDALRSREREAHAAADGDHFV